jgi:hypothetical protein
MCIQIHNAMAQISLTYTSIDMSSIPSHPPDVFTSWKLQCQRHLVEVPSSANRSDSAARKLLAAGFMACFLHN